MTQLLFEQLNANGVFFAEESVLSLYSVGKVSGVSIDMAHSGINVMAVVDGQPMAQTATRIPCGGRELSAMMQGLRKSGSCSSGLICLATHEVRLGAGTTLMANGDFLSQAWRKFMGLRR